jgi:hypothetical protein
MFSSLKRKVALALRPRAEINAEHQQEIATEPDATVNPAPPDEPYMEAAYYDWREFYANRERNYADIIKELGERDDAYSNWYRKGGYGYEPKQSRKWLLTQTSLPDFRGTCLDIGSGDGFWSWLLSEWYHVTGVEPMPGVVDISNAIKRRLPQSIQRRVDFEVRDGLDVDRKYDVVFCRAPSFFNYPIFGEFNPNLLDPERKRLREFHALKNPDSAEARTETYKSTALSAADVAYLHSYAGHWREYLEKMLSNTNKMFLFIMWTSPVHFGTYVGNTYCHDPVEVEKIFKQYGECSVRLDDDQAYVVGEIYR